MCWSGQLSGGETTNFPTVTLAECAESTGSEKHTLEQISSISKSEMGNLLRKFRIYRSRSAKTALPFHLLVGTFSFTYCTYEVRCGYIYKINYFGIIFCQMKPFSVPLWISSKKCYIYGTIPTQINFLLARDPESKHISGIRFAHSNSYYRMLNRHFLLFSRKTEAN